MLFLNGVTDVLKEIATRVKDRRLQLELTQQGLAHRSGVSLGSIKRFEQSGKISFESLVKIAFVLDMHHQFEEFFQPQEVYKSLDDVMKTEKKRQRGSIT